MSLEPDALITLILKVDTPHNQIESESAVHHCTDIASALSQTHISLWLEPLYGRLRRCSLCISLSHRCLTDILVELCLPACTANEATAKVLALSSAKCKEFINVLVPFSIQLSCLFSLGQRDKDEMQGKAWGVIPWSQKSYKICVPVPTSLKNVLWL